MFPVTHLLAPVLLVNAYLWRTGKPFSWRYTAAAAFFGVLPDLLNLHISLADRVSWSHSLLVLLPLLLLLTGAWRWRRRWLPYTVLAVTGVGLHLGLDIVSNPYNFLYPLNFDPVYPVLSQCGYGTMICWYSVDVVLVIGVLLLVIHLQRVTDR